MNLKELKDLIAQGESDSLEFKESTTATGLQKAGEALCGFLNNKGGYVLFGVKDNGQIIGQEVSDKTKRELAQNLLVLFEPHPSFTVQYIKIDPKKTVIAIYADVSLASPPYYFKKIPYCRHQSGRGIMPRTMLEELLEKYKFYTKSWDGLPATLDFNELDESEILQTFEECKAKGRIKKGISASNAKEVLALLDLLKGESITNAAAVLFCKDPGNHYMQCYIKLAAFNDVEKRNIIDNKQISGNIFTLMEEAEAFFLRHISISGKFIPGKMKRVDEPDYPPRAFREALLNAFAHRDYTIAGGSVGVMMFKDRMEIFSHGKLPASIKIEDLKTTHTSHPRNSLILKTLYRRGVIEELGIGTQEMVSDCASLEIPAPEFIEQGNVFSVIFRKKIKTLSNNITLYDQFDLNERQEKILQILNQHKDLTRQRLSALLDLGVPDRTLLRDLSKLKELGLINSTGKGPKIAWYVTQN